MRARNSRSVIWTIGILLALLPAGNLLALTDEEVFRDFRFNFLNPGARALGLGGAFIAAADDATAAEANPAGLHYIFKKQFFAEYRAIRNEPFRTSTTTGDVTDVNSNAPFVNLGAGSEQEDEEIATFMSVAFPFRIGKGDVRATLALSRSVMLDFTTVLQDPVPQLDFSFSGFPTIANPQTGQLERYSVVNTSNGRLDAELINQNIAFSLNYKDFSFGVTGTHAELNMRSNLSNRAQDPRGVVNTINPRVDVVAPFGPTNLDDIQTRSVIDDDDTDFTYTVGIHYHPDTFFAGKLSPVRFGAVYRKGAELSVQQRVQDLSAGTEVLLDSFQNTLRVPDRFGLGVFGQLGRKGRLKVALDLERIEYSDLLKDFKAGKNFFTSGILDPSLIDPNREIVFDVDDATVVHMGISRILPTGGPWSFGVSAGYFNAPDNRIRMTQFNSNDQQINQTFEKVFGGGEDENHLTGGFQVANGEAGITFYFAGDFADSADQYLFSMIWRFGNTVTGGGN